MPEVKTRPWWLENREPEPLMMICLDQDEVDEWGRLFATAGMSVTGSSALASEAHMRSVCDQKGVPFTPEMAAVAAQMARHAGDGERIPSLDEQFGKHGGIEAYLDKCCPDSTALMSLSRKRKTAPPKLTAAESAMVKKIETAQAELAAVHKEVETAEAEAALAQASLTAAKKAATPPTISRLAGRSAK